jgi:flagellar biosynthesis protein FliR
VTILEITLQEYLLFALVLVRMSGMVVFAPFFGGENLPRRARRRGARASPPGRRLPEIGRAHV